MPLNANGLSKKVSSAFLQESVFLLITRFMEIFHFFKILFKSVDKVIVDVVLSYRGSNPLKKNRIQWSNGQVSLDKRSLKIDIMISEHNTTIFLNLKCSPSEFNSKKNSSTSDKL